MPWTIWGTILSRPFVKEYLSSFMFGPVRSPFRQCGTVVKIRINCLRDGNSNTFETKKPLLNFAIWPCTTLILKEYLWSIKSISLKSLGDMSLVKRVDRMTATVYILLQKNVWPAVKVSRGLDHMHFPTSFLFFLFSVFFGYTSFALSAIKNCV
jgi:hypothetical protein